MLILLLTSLTLAVLVCSCKIYQNIATESKGFAGLFFFFCFAFCRQQEILKQWCVLAYWYRGAGRSSCLWTWEITFYPLLSRGWWFLHLAGHMVPGEKAPSHSFSGWHLRGGSAAPRLAEAADDPLRGPAPRGCRWACGMFQTLLKGKGEASLLKCAQISYLDAFAWSHLSLLLL